jgi:UDP-2-acetamido-3-amino-2,3-dideoxy-glucuronate N-acetyltransferase
MNRLNVALVGLGYWGKNLLRAFALTPTACLTLLCDVDGEACMRAAAEHPRLRTTSDYAQVLASPDVDGVLLATPPSAHHGMALAALRAGKHVWVEKPLALSARAGRELVDAAAAAGLVLFVDETFLYDPLVREMKRLIDGGALGEVCRLSFERLGMGRIRRDSNVWWNSAPHDLSILFHLVPRRLVRAQLHQHAYLQPGIADMAVCDLELEGGVSAHVHVSWLHPEKTAKVIVIGRERMLSYEGRFGKRGLVLYDYALGPMGTDAGNGRAPIVPIERFAAQPLEVPAGDEPLALAAAHFVESARTGTEPLTSGARSLRVVEALEAAEHGTITGGQAG